MHEDAMLTERTMRVASKNYSFCLPFRWGFRLQCACTACACPSRQTEAKTLRDTHEVARPGAKAARGSQHEPIEADRSSLRELIEADRAVEEPARANRAACTRRSRQIEQPGPRESKLASW